MELLPDNVLVEIFKNLQPGELHTARQVCAKWKYLSALDCVWTNQELEWSGHDCFTDESAITARHKRETKIFFLSLRVAPVLGCLHLDTLNSADLELLISELSNHRPTKVRKLIIEMGSAAKLEGLLTLLGFFGQTVEILGVDCRLVDSEEQLVPIVEIPLPKLKCLIVMRWCGNDNYTYISGNPWPELQEVQFSEGLQERDRQLLAALSSQIRKVSVNPVQGYSVPPAMDVLGDFLDIEHGFPVLENVKFSFSDWRFEEYGDSLLVGNSSHDASACNFCNMLTTAVDFLPKSSLTLSIKCLCFTFDLIFEKNPSAKKADNPKLTVSQSCYPKFADDLLQRWKKLFDVRATYALNVIFSHFPELESFSVTCCRFFLEIARQSFAERYPTKRVKFHTMCS